VIGVAALDTGALDAVALLPPTTLPAELPAEDMLPDWVAETVAVAVTGDAAGMDVTGEDVAVGVTSVKPVPEEMHMAPLG